MTIVSICAIYLIIRKSEISNLYLVSFAATKRNGKSKAKQSEYEGNLP